MTVKDVLQIIFYFTASAAFVVSLGASMTYCESHGELNSAECTTLCEQHVAVQRYSRCECNRRMP
jgi:hypothetical protein